METIHIQKERQKIAATRAGLDEYEALLDRVAAHSSVMAGKLARINRTNTKAKRIREAVAAYPGAFDIDALEPVVNASGDPIPRNEISFALARMRKAGAITVVSKSRGRRSSIFTRAAKA